MAFVRAAVTLFLLVFAAGLAPHLALAAEPILVEPDVKALDLTHAVEYRRDAGNSIQVSTAPGPDGVVRPSLPAMTREGGVAARAKPAGRNRSSARSFVKSVAYPCQSDGLRIDAVQNAAL